MMRHRKSTLATIALAGLLAADCWVLIGLSRSHSAALADVGELQDSLTLAAEIRSSRRLPAAAAEQERESVEISQLIEASAKATGIDPRSLLRITPGPARRIEDSLYKEKPTSVLLKDVTLEQFAGLLGQLSASELGLTTRSLRLAAPSMEDAGALWNTEFTVSYLLYDPPKPIGTNP
jgi:hypothetical protein